MPEQEIGVVNPDEAIIESTSPNVVTGERVIIDGAHDKEVVILDPIAGASSAAPAVSGIPSAMKQQGVRGEETTDTEETHMADRDLPRRQDIKP